MMGVRGSVARRRSSGGSSGVTATDNFNRADSDDLGASWTQIASRLAVNGNQLAPDSTASGACRRVLSPTTDNLFSQLTFQAWPSGSTFTTGPCIHMPALGAGVSSTGSFYIFTPIDSGQTTVGLRRHDFESTAFTNLGSTVSYTLTTGDVFRIESNSTEVIGYVDGVEIIRRSKSDAPLTETGERGVGIYSTGNMVIRMDDWSGGDA